ncbi:MAG TPA: hypothetical protein VN282_17120 [Pyrinomonadaceae bacterium]|nr:hypothetical protein [Pyrinomonadaceae bacterium]
MPLKSLTPNYVDDIFISYDHDDNRPLLEDHQGWVDSMHVSLEIRLTQVMGEKPRIRRDTKESGNKEVMDALLCQLGNTASLVFILSPSYVRSPCCKQELEEFYKSALRNGGLKVGDRLRIFKVVKTPVDESDPHADPREWSELPHDLRGTLQKARSYEFYEFDSVSGKLKEYWPELGPPYRVKYLMTICDLAYDIKAFINECKQATASEPAACDRRRQSPPVPARSDYVYLAETTPDLSEERRAIKRELQQYGYHVLPDEGLPFEKEDFEEKVGKYLAQSALSIHLIGADYAAVPGGTQASAVLDSQHMVAARRVCAQHESALSRGEGDPDFSRLIWMPEGIKAQEKSYQEYISYLQNAPGVSEGGEVLCGVKLEDLKTRIKEKLKDRPPADSAGANKRIYLYCYKNELSAMAPIQQYLAERGYDVMLPFAGTSKFSSGHKENLRLCDAVIIYSGDDNVEFRLDEFSKVEGYRDNKPLLAKGVLVAGPETDCKKSFHTESALVMKNFGEFSPQSLRPFLSQLEESAAQSRARGARV